MFISYQKWGLAVHPSKSNREARLVERKVWFILEDGMGGGEKWTLSNSDLLPLETITELIAEEEDSVQNSLWTAILKSHAVI